MATSDAYIKLFLYTLHLILYSILRCYQIVYWRLAGIQKHLDSCKCGESYEESAQLLRVWSRGKPAPLTILYQRHFISTHVKFVHPEYALQKHITLMTVTEKEAIFCVTSKEEDILDVRKWPFLFDAQYRLAEYILMMPISSLIRLADSLGDPTAKVIWIHHTGRCGSTAIAQAFNALPNVVTISEMICGFSLNQAFKYKYFGKWDYDWECSQEHLKIYQSTTRLLLKPGLKQADIIVVKTTPLTVTGDIRLIHKLFPKFVNIYMYRDSKEQVLSQYRAAAGHSVHAEVTSAIASNQLLTSLLPNIQPLRLMHNSCSYAEHVRWLFNKENIFKSTEFISFVARWAEICFHFKEFKEDPNHQLTMLAFKYEHWLSDRGRYLKTLFDYVGMDLTEERYRLVSEALSEDSQANTHLSRDKIQKRQVEITHDMIEEANRYLRYYQLPEWGESLTLPNTVTSY